MDREHIFGYGSLVNRATHDYTDLKPGKLHGWRRVWQHTSLRRLAYLSVEPHATSSLSGMIMQVEGVDPSLESREASYLRNDISGQLEPAQTQTGSVNVFAIPAHIHATPASGTTLLLSYIDVVVQGYLREFGEAGAQEFFETTHGWGAQILDDRAQPKYPRHQPLSNQETALTDHWLNALSAQVE